MPAGVQFTFRMRLEQRATCGLLASCRALLHWMAAMALAAMRANERRAALAC